MAQSTPLSLPTALVSPARIRSYVLRLPLFTRITILLILLFYVLEFQSVWSVVNWGSLKPSVIGIFTGGMHRLNTYIFIHTGFFHMFFNTLALVPLMERFEKECGTLTSIALWAGPLATIPGGLYILVERGIWGGDAAICGASGPVFLLVASEGVRSWRANPFFEIAGVKVPTWITPILLAIVTAILIPGTSLLGHVCSLAVGYLCKSYDHSPTCLSCRY
jgi:GPI-anchor transamidase subunit GAA1